ncbi:hypothetical protein I6I98_08810 [Sphingobacterium multivorum]|uniref:TIGR02646 family protein n=1 Tax=Sphingobacterium multivorum TaxID=28454 RepID=A0ABX7CT96_SPHMU|nr:hypothetical protein [Sphingobacterium multivorum]QQT55338.1 hypothetical protein I6I98_08810 [Sphingobacterium multivorum]
MIFINTKYLDTRGVPLSLNRLSVQNKLTSLFLGTCTASDFGTDHYGKDDVTDRLKAYSLGKLNLEPNDEPKCYYCESRCQQVATLQVEHFRPKKTVELQDTNGVHHSGYYWLVVDWHNLLLACPACNGRSAKGNRFPILGARATTNTCNLQLERQLLINPEIEDPSRYLTFNSEGQIFGTGNKATCKGYTSIPIYQLNRDSLVVRRKKIWDEYSNEISEAVFAVKNRYFSIYSIRPLFKLIIIKIKKTQNQDAEYSLWGRYINDNIRYLIRAVPIGIKYQDLFIKLYKNL